MRLLMLALSLLLVVRPLAAQTTTKPAAAPPATEVRPAPDTDDAGLDRIRRGLKTARDRPLLEQGLERTADFRVEVLEQAQFYEFLSKMEVPKGPAPPGGIYGYEQQRRLFSPTSRPLAQPYAAFSGGELITIALQNILGRYLVDKLMNAASSRDAQSAREEVAREVAAYCGSRPDRVQIAICNPKP
jgi:hypothetical protein